MTYADRWQPYALPSRAVLLCVSSSWLWPFAAKFQQQSIYRMSYCKPYVSEMEEHWRSLDVCWRELDCCMVFPDNGCRWWASRWRISALIRLHLCPMPTPRARSFSCVSDDDAGVALWQVRSARARARVVTRRRANSLFIIAAMQREPLWYNGTAAAAAAAGEPLRYASH